MAMIIMDHPLLFHSTIGISSRKTALTTSHAVPAEAAAGMIATGATQVKVITLQ